MIHENLQQFYSNSPPYLLNQSNKQFFNKNGFLHLKGVLPEKLCLTLIKEATEYANGDYINYWHMHEYKRFKDVHTGPTLCHIADQILEFRMIPVGSTFFFCRPQNEKEFGSVWHTDNLAAKAPHGAWLTIAVALNDADESNGSLQFVSGSHMWKNPNDKDQKYAKHS